MITEWTLHRTFARIAEDPAFHFSKVLVPGDIEIIHNPTILHSRGDIFEGEVSRLPTAASQGRLGDALMLCLPCRAAQAKTDASAAQHALTCAPEIVASTCQHHGVTAIVPV